MTNHVKCRVEQLLREILMDPAMVDIHYLASGLLTEIDHTPPPMWENAHAIVVSFFEAFTFGRVLRDHLEVGMDLRSAKDEASKISAAARLAVDGLCKTRPVG